MIDQTEELEKLRKIIFNNRLSSVTDDEIRNWYNILFAEIEQLKKRRIVFSIGRTNHYLFVILFLIILNFLILGLINILGFDNESIFSIVITLIFWGGIFLYYPFLHDYLDFVSEAIKKERTRITKELNIST